MAGLSLVELMISITIGLMILSGVAFVFVNTSSARNEVERTSRQIENGRYAVEVISDDLRLAGFFGELNPAAASPAIAVPAVLPDPCAFTPDDLTAAIPVHVQGYDNGAGAPTLTCMAGLNIKPNTDIVLVRRARTCVAGSAGCEAIDGTKAYLQLSLCAGETTTHAVGPGSTAPGTAPFVLTNKSCGANFAGRRQYVINIYYISNDNGAIPAVIVPTLKRLEFNGAGFDVTPLVEGIEEFNVEYGLDTSGDGAPDSYSANPATVGDWMNVVTVQFYVLARNLETSPGYTDPKTYGIGLKADGSPLTVNPGLGYRRHVYSSLVRLNNPAGRRDTP